MPRILNKDVGELGFGLMGFTWRPQPPPLDQALDALKAAVDNGATFWNGAEFYGTPEYNSMTLLNHYFTKYPEDADKVIIVIKGGADPDTHQADGTDEGIRRSLDNILAQLGGKKKLDLFSSSRRDQNVPFEKTLRFIQKEYIDTGKLGGISLSECRAETIHEAVKYAKIEAVEVELSMFSPDILKNGVAAACAQHNIPIAAYSPIGRGMLTGRFKESSDFKDRGIIAGFPRFQPEAFEHNMKLVKQVQALAEQKGCTAAQLAIAWVRSLSNRPGLPTIIPIPGSTAAARVEENAKIIQLTDGEIATITDIVDNFETAGDRYPAFVPTNT